MPGDGSQAPALWPGAAPLPRRGRETGSGSVIHKRDPLLVNKTCILCRALWLTGVAAPTELTQTSSYNLPGTRDGEAASWRPSGPSWRGSLTVSTSPSCPKLCQLVLTGMVLTHPPGTCCMGSGKWQVSGRGKESGASQEPGLS